MRSWCWNRGACWSGAPTSNFSRKREPTRLSGANRERGRSALRRDPRRFRDIAAHAEGIFYLSRRHHAADVTENVKLRLSMRGTIAVIKDFCIGRPLRHEALIGGRVVFERVSRYCLLNAEFSFSVGQSAAIARIGTMVTVVVMAVDSASNEILPRMRMISP